MRTEIEIKVTDVVTGKSIERLNGEASRQSINQAAFSTEGNSTMKEM